MSNTGDHTLSAKEFDETYRCLNEAYVFRNADVGDTAVFNGRYVTKLSDFHYIELDTGDIVGFAQRFASSLHPGAYTEV